MRVNQSGNNPVQGNDEALVTKKAERTANAKSSKKSGQVTDSAKNSTGATADISAKGREYAHAKSVASGGPDVREEKIAELKRRIASGKYNVDADAVADKMVNEHLDMQGIG